MESNRTGKKSLNGLLLILAVALIIRLIYLLVYSNLPEWNQLTIDNNYHLHWAESIADGNIIGETTWFRAPLYVYCLGGLFALFGTSLWAARLFGMVIGLLSVWMTFVLGRRLFSSHVGLLAATIQALFPVVYYFESELLLDPLYMLLLQVAVHRILIWIQTGHPRDILLAGLFIGLAAITRPTGLVLLMILLPLMWIRRHKLVGLGKQLALLFVGLVLTVGPITARNFIVASDPVLIASQGGINFFIGNNEFADGISASLPPPLGINWQLSQIEYLAENSAGRQLKPGEISSWWANQALTWIEDNPGKTISLFVSKLVRSLGNEEISNNRVLAIFFESHPMLAFNPLCFGIVFAFAVIGLVSERRRIELRVTGAMLAAMMCVTALFFFSSRFRLPLLPFFFVLASAGVFYLKEYLSMGGRKLYLILSLAVGAAALSFGSGAAMPIVNRPTDSLAKGIYYYGLGDYQLALRHQRVAARIDSTFYDVNLTLGTSFLRLGLADSARYYFEREIAFHPERPKAYANMASLELINGEPQAAILLAREALIRHPNDIAANLVMLRAAYKLDSIDIDSFASLIRQGRANTHDDLTLMIDAAIMLTGRNALHEAERLLLDALSSRPVPVEIDDYAFNQVWRNSAKRRLKEKARANYQLGFLYGQMRKFPDAISYTRRSISADSTRVEAYINLISGYLVTNQPEQADSIFAIAIAKFPDNSSLHQIGDRLHQ